MTTTTWQLVLGGRRRFVPQQFRQGRGPGLVKRYSQTGLHRFQVGSAALLAFREYAGEPAAYFARNFRIDCSRRFFSWSVQPPRSRSTGRRWQIFWLMLTKLSLSSWKR